MNLSKLSHIQLYLKTASAVRMDVGKIQREVMDLHKRRKVAKLTSAVKMTPIKIREASAIDQAYRSRIVGLLLDCKHVVNMLEPLKDATILRCLIDFYDDISPSTKTEKKEYLSFYLDTKVPVLPKLYGAIDTAQIIIDDIDRASWTLKLHMSSFDLASRHEVHL